jgi:hypothetical protein
VEKRKHDALTYQRIGREFFTRRASKIFGWWVLGLGRPSPLFDERTNAPRAAPRVLNRGTSAYTFERRSAWTSHVTKQQRCQYIFRLECRSIHRPIRHCEGFPSADLPCCSGVCSAAAAPMVVVPTVLVPFG